MKTAYLQTSYIKKNLNYVELKEVILKKKLSYDKGLLVKEHDKFIYIPILASLQQVLSNDSIAKLILKKPKL